jgi:hypothetical protein
LLLPLMCLLSATAAEAADGVIEINQARALAGGVTPGDAPLFPVTLSERGSYRLTGNLTSPIGTDAILITSPDVTLDLGGFDVRSTNVCRGYPITDCDVQFGDFMGIRASQQLVVVRNGGVQAMAGNCIWLAGPSSVVEHVRVAGCGTHGIVVGGAGRVAHSFSGGSFGNGIYLADRGGMAEGNESRGNRGNGIQATGGDLGGTLFANRTYDNGSAGIHVEGPVLVSRNVAAANTGGSILFFLFNRSLFDNLCNGSFC